MSEKQRLSRFTIILVLASLVMFGCQLTSAPEADLAATPTPTEPALGMEPPEEDTHPCATLSGSLEMQVLVGPSEAVGMEPVAVGEIPFSVVSQNGVYAIQGGGPLNFDEQVFEAEWGTYTVTFNADSELSGECVSQDGGAVLNMTVTMEGEQMVSVRAEGLQGDYPWTGTQAISASFPAEEGATESGEGWVLVLHLAP